MKEHNRSRLDVILERYHRRQAPVEVGARADFAAEFERVVTDLIEPLMGEFATALRARGHEPRIVRPAAAPWPAVELELGLAGGRGSRNVVGFAVIRRGTRPFEVLAYLEVHPPPFDLDRFARPAELRAEVVERILVEAIEHVVACNAP